MEAVLAPDALAPSKARKFLAEVLADKAGSEWLDRAQLVLSEVVSNAVRHGGLQESGPIRVAVERTERLVTFTVTQPGPIPERPSIVNMPDPWSKGGYGLGIIDEVADRWGVHPDPPSVWFELEM